MKASELLNDGRPDYDNAADVYELADASNALTDVSIELFKHSCETADSSMISPYSILQATAMCANGAEGDTLRQIESALGLKLDDINEWSLAYARRLTCYEDGAPFESANAVWLREDGFAPGEEFLRRASAYYGASTYSAPMDADTTSDINGWVKEKTGGRIDELVSEINPNVNALLVNAVYFKDSWSEPYEASQVEDGSFTTADGTRLDAKLMCSDEDQFIEGVNFTGFRKYYQKGSSFVALLPSEGTSVEEVIAGLDGISLREALDNSRFGIVHTKLPKFKSEYTSTGVMDGLRALGIENLFSPELADLSGIGSSEKGNLFIGEIAHKTYIDVSEEGTEAAAATGMMAMSAMAPPEEEYFVYLDRPFVYAIIDDATGVPLFIGTCMGI